MWRWLSYACPNVKHGTTDAQSEVKSAFVLTNSPTPPYPAHKHILLYTYLSLRSHETKRTLHHHSLITLVRIFLSAPDMADTQPRPNDAVPSKERLGTRCCHCLCQTFWILLVLIITIVMLAILVLYIIITPRSFRFIIFFNQQILIISCIVILAINFEPIIFL